MSDPDTSADFISRMRTFLRTYMSAPPDRQAEGSTVMDWYVDHMDTVERANKIYKDLQELMTREIHLLDSVAKLEKEYRGCSITLKQIDPPNPLNAEVNDVLTSTAAMQLSAARRSGSPTASGVAHDEEHNITTVTSLPTNPNDEDFASSFRRYVRDFPRARPDRAAEFDTMLDWYVRHSLLLSKEEDLKATQVAMLGDIKKLEENENRLEIKRNALKDAVAAAQHRINQTRQWQQVGGGYAAPMGMAPRSNHYQPHPAAPLHGGQAVVPSSFQPVNVERKPSIKSESHRDSSPQSTSTSPFTPVNYPKPTHKSIVPSTRRISDVEADSPSGSPEERQHSAQSLSTFSVHAAVGGGEKRRRHNIPVELPNCRAVKFFTPAGMLDHWLPMTPEQETDAVDYAVMFINKCLEEMRPKGDPSSQTVKQQWYSLSNFKIDSQEFGPKILASAQGVPPDAPESLRKERSTNWVGHPNLICLHHRKYSGMLNKCKSGRYLNGCCQAWQDPLSPVFRRTGTRKIHPCVVLDPDENGSGTYLVLLPWPTFQTMRPGNPLGQVTEIAPDTAGNGTSPDVENEMKDDE